MESYIVRIYQRDDTHLVGVVETTDGDEQELVFSNAGELWHILTTSHPGMNTPAAEDQDPSALD